MSADTYQLITDRIIAKLEAGTIPWKHFASSPLAEPKNFVSKKAYRGINHFLLSVSIQAITGSRSSRLSTLAAM